MATSLGGPGWRSLIQGAGLSLVLRLAGAGLGLAFNLLLARTAGAEGAGLFFLAFSVSGLVALAARLGLDAIAMRQTAAGAAKAEWGEVAADGRAALVIAAAMALLATLALWLVAPLLADRLFGKPALVPVLQGLALTIAPMSLTTILAELLRGLHSLLRSQALQALITATVALPLLAMAGAQADAEAAVWAQVAGSSVSCVLGAWWWRTEMRARCIEPSNSTGDLRFSILDRAVPILRSAMPLFWFAVLSALMGTMDVLVLGRLGSTADIGIYGVAVRLAMLTSFILMAANSYAGPHYAAANALGDMVVLRRLAVRSAQVTTAVAAPLLLLFVAVPSELMGLFGQGFKAGGTVLVVLALGQFVNVATGSAGQILIMTGHEKDMRNISFMAAAVTLAALFVFAPAWGAFGVAVATVMGVVTQKILAIRVVKKRLGLTIHAFARELSR
jgi:O-antigen/teichoic acid export membrane protein